MDDSRPVKVLTKKRLPAKAYLKAVTERRAKYERLLLLLARAVTVGGAYVVVAPIPGLTSSFVAIFTALLPFDTFVAMPSPLVRLRDWEQFLAVLKPRVLSTASTLAKGITLGALFGVGAIAGLPEVPGAVLTAGLAYVWALETPYAISTYVSIISGLGLFERLAALDAVDTAQIASEALAAISLSVGGTFTALVAGWGVGLLTGSVTRLFLSRPYRSIRSSAYELPLAMRPFNEVIHLGEKSLVASAAVEEGASLAHRTLEESGLREKWGTTVLAIKRDGEEIVMPGGATTLLPGDQVLLFAERENAPAVFDQLKAPVKAPADSRDRKGAEGPGGKLHEI